MVHITISTQDALLSVGIMCCTKAHMKGPIFFVNLIAHSTQMISKLIVSNNIRNIS